MTRGLRNVVTGAFLLSACSWVPMELPAVGSLPVPHSRSAPPAAEAPPRAAPVAGVEVTLPAPVGDVPLAEPFELVGFGVSAVDVLDGVAQHLAPVAAKRPANAMSAISAIPLSVVVELVDTTSPTQSPSAAVQVGSRYRTF